MFCFNIKNIKENEVKSIFKAQYHKSHICLKGLSTVYNTLYPSIQKCDFYVTFTPG